MNNREVICKSYSQCIEPLCHCEKLDQQPILPQIEAFAEVHDIELDKGWKVTLAKSAKQTLKSKAKDGIEDAYIASWSKLFEHFC